ncbi:hypothetical protein DB32_004065 [Sandaracinus amylolyticus]|uniref:Lipoprotein n=2 Tax=Sandaracinus amylolyticus TaxID=927083 RepID=A0A0F6YJD9_9BACT|nr:hypothetical protein DB32_004065 [Sandaracinus amylolyticus]
MLRAMQPSRSSSLTRSVLSLSLVATLGACGSEEPAAPELDTAGVVRGGEGLLATALVFDVVDALGELGTLVPTSAVETVAGNIHGSALRVVSTCGTVTLDGTTVSATIQGQGCELPPPEDPEAPPPVWIAPGGATAGSMEIVASRDGEDLVLTLTLDDLLVHDRTLDGTTTLRTADGFEWNVALDLDVTGGAEAVHVSSDATLSPTTTSRTIDGAITVEGTTVTTTYDAREVEWARDACYPDNGALWFDDVAERETRVTFDDESATSGVVTVSFPATVEMPDPVDMSATLPVYGECP